MTSTGLNRSVVLPLYLDSVISISVSVPLQSLCHFVWVTFGKPKLVCIKAVIFTLERNEARMVWLDVMYTIGTSARMLRGDFFD